MLVLPLVSAVAMTICMALIFGVAFTQGGSGWRLFLAGAIATFPMTFFSSFFNVAFLAMAEDAVAGRDPTVARGLRVARDRLGAIAAWSGLATVVALGLHALQQIPYVGSSVGRAINIVGGLAWGAATFFVLPIIALHGTGARESVRRSAHTFRERWGEAVTGDVAMGGVLTLLILPAAIVIGVGIVLWNAEIYAAGALLFLAGIAVFVAAFTVTGAVTALFQLFLYRHVALDSSDGPFAVADLERGVKPKRAPFWRR
jgi:hypothetical protein